MLQNPSLRVAIWGKDFHTRRLHQKALFYRMPGRPLIKWCYMMFVRGAVLDGAAVAFDCRIERIVEVGTHDVFFCAVEAVEMGAAHEGLIYYGRNYHRIVHAG